MESTLHLEFNAIMSYDDWTVFEYKSKYYVANENGINEVALVKKVEVKEDIEDIKDVIGPCNYCGQSDDLRLYLGFDVVA